jgi:hypothetical protein
MDAIPCEGALGTYRAVVWAITVEDPAKHLVDANVRECTADTAAVTAAQHGAAFLWCNDDNGDDTYPYYRWYVRLPQEEHRRRTEQGMPVAVEAVYQALKDALPARLDGWSVWPDDDISFDDELSAHFRDVYADLLDVVDARLTPLRCDGAESIDPRARWWQDRLSDGSMVANYTVWLGLRPEQVGWVCLTVGFVADALPGEPVGRTWVASDVPVLLLPRPRRHRTWTWMANLKLGGFIDDPGRPGTIATRPSDGSRYQWQAGDPQRLVDLIEHDLRLLLPNLRW